MGASAVVAVNKPFVAMRSAGLLNSADRLRHPRIVKSSQVCCFTSRI